MDDNYFAITGYDKETLPLSDSPLNNSNNMTMLIDKFVDMSQCQYSDDEGTPIGLEGSSLLAQLPWFTPWDDLFKPIEPVKVFLINWC